MKKCINFLNFQTFQVTGRPEIVVAGGSDVRRADPGAHRQQIHDADP